MSLVLTKVLITPVMQNNSFNGQVSTGTVLPYVMGDELKRSYGKDFKYISMAT
jgi:putative ABC transport system permease protein